MYEGCKITHFTPKLQRISKQGNAFLITYDTATPLEAVNVPDA